MSYCIFKLTINKVFNPIQYKTLQETLVETSTGAKAVVELHMASMTGKE